MKCIEIQFGMKELSRTNWLLIAVFALVIVIIGGLIDHKRPLVQYTLTPAESLALLDDPALMLTPEQAAALLKDSAGQTVFMDVRNVAAFNNGHVPNAIHMPAQEVFSEKSIALFREFEEAGKTVVLYGETQRQAHGPWQLLQQTGFQHVKLFSGVYAQLNPLQADSLVARLPQWSETPLIDTTALKNISAPAPTAEKTVEPAPAKKEKKFVAPVKREEASGEGC